MISELNGVEKGKAVGQVAVPETLMGFSGWCSTSTTEGLFLSQPYVEVLAGDLPLRHGSKCGFPAGEDFGCNFSRNDVPS